MTEATGPTPEDDVLFSPEDLAKWLGYQVSSTRAQFLEQQVSARFLNTTGLAEWPNPLPAVVKSWAVEYAALHYENPTALSDDRSGETFQRWNPRGREILADLVTWSERRTPSAATGGPIGQFPPARPFPDPVEVCPRW